MGQAEHLLTGDFGFTNNILSLQRKLNANFLHGLVYFAYLIRLLDVVIGEDSYSNSCVL